MTAATPRLAVTMGDPAGVGPEIVVKALADGALHADVTPIVIGDVPTLERAARSSGTDVRFVRFALHEPIADRWTAGDAIPVIDLANVPADLVLGQVSADGGRAAWDYVRAAVELCTHRGADAIVTGPLNKASLSAAGLQHQGHTEILQTMTSSPWSLTMFVLDRLRAVYLTRHVSLREAIDQVTRDRILTTIERICQATPQLGLADPHIAVAALNPHGGEDGLFGREELDEIAPAVEAARSSGYRVSGPIPADSVFFKARDGSYDIVLGLYHDQIASVFKSVSFHETVSITLGLPFLRFSVDHGTAFDIAGTGTADHRNMRTTIELAAAVAGGAL